MIQSTKMKIAIYSPYLDTAGGGEKYMMTIAEHLSKKETVELLLDTHLQTLDIKTALEKVQKLHDLDLSRVHLVNAPFGPGTSMLGRLKFLRKYDILIALTDGSIFPNSAKRGLLHFQVPFENTNAKGITGRLKLRTWKKAFFNSEFTKKIVEKTWSIHGDVIYPPVSTEMIKPLPKKKQILSVGRFFGYLKDKKHDVMIEAFKKLAEMVKNEGWSLHLLGAAAEGDISYVEELRNAAENYPIFFYPNASYAKLLELYGESSIYWHAAGYEETDPKRFEHFGMSTVEAMAGGCVPVVINKGGQAEIVVDGKSGLLWDTTEELIDKTLGLIHNQKQQADLSKGAIERAEDFSKSRFEKEIDSLVYG
jgi:glycosyltransferase involved in cell wall biosynthesis